MFSRKREENNNWFDFKRTIFGSPFFGSSSKSAEVVCKCRRKETTPEDTTTSTLSKVYFVKRVFFEAVFLIERNFEAPNCSPVEIIHFVEEALDNFKSSDSFSSSDSD